METKPKAKQEDYSYKIEKGVAMWDIAHLQSIDHPGPRYPFPFMEIGDSFFVPFSDFDEDIATTIESRIRNACYHFRKNNIGVDDRKFSSRIDTANGGIRVWRIR